MQMYKKKIQQTNKNEEYFRLIYNRLKTFCLFAFISAIGINKGLKLLVFSCVQFLKRRLFSQCFSLLL
jgi:hypothetical protein